MDFFAVTCLEAGGNHSFYSAAVFLRQARELFPDTFLVIGNSSGVTGYTVGAGVQDNSKKAWILRLKVKENHRGRSLGRILVEELCNRFHAKGIHEAWLSVAPDNKSAMRLYSGLDFEIVEMLPEYFGPGEDRYLMKKSLG
ncbi:MAG TPA: N-acetyltransferase [Methanoregulaceae archaeon]|nr:N-acetyltransferase [Methanoregulaceae archaeon]